MRRSARNLALQRDFFNQIDDIADRSAGIYRATSKGPLAPKKAVIQKILFLTLKLLPLKDGRRRNSTDPPLAY
jgi:hypothetical protein